LGIMLIKPSFTERRTRIIINVISIKAVEKHLI
jgi:hypothetical protein